MKMQTFETKNMEKFQEKASLFFYLESAQQNQMLVFEKEIKFYLRNPLRYSQNDFDENYFIQLQIFLRINNFSKHNNKNVIFYQNPTVNFFDQFFSQCQQENKMIEIKLSNQSRTDKKQGRIFNAKPSRYHYNKGRNEIHHRIKRLLKKQNNNLYQCYTTTNLDIDPMVKEEADNQAEKLVKFWGGKGQFRGLQFKKLGRMDKIKLKETEKEWESDQDSIQARNKLALIKRVFSRLDNKLKKAELSLGMMQINSCKKPSRYVPLQIQFKITSR